ncbi:MAG: GNAT family N-acetyltransferase [Nannocystaceae bacterium]|nr:GNAT family N-acetyltransferase [Nannocystaceae bacterium]
MPPTRIRPATPDDAATIVALIRELAVYEREPDAVELTVPQLREQLAASTPPFECVLAEHDGDPVGFALFFHNYSTWRGRPGLYLEDLYVTPAARGAGVGKALLQHLAQLAVQRGCARFEWAVLDWNEPAIGFYRRLGAEPLDAWTVYRLSGEALARLAAR